MMGLSDPLGDRQSEPSAILFAARGIGTKEAIENARQKGRWYADSIVGDGEESVLSFASECNLDTALARRIFDGIIHQCPNKTAEQNCIANNVQVLVWNAIDKALPLIPGKYTHSVDHFQHHLRQVDGLHGELARLRRRTGPIGAYPRGDGYSVRLR